MSYRHTTYRNDGIRSTAILPGETDTPILDSRAQPPTAEERAVMLQPDDVAAAVLLAASLPQRAVIEELRIAATRLRDTSRDIEAARWSGAPDDLRPPRS
jgi:NADP-dependent 3-hydroxy acid dehydrogenase YdfG